jgi:hypothetical protein
MTGVSMTSGGRYASTVRYEERNLGPVRLHFFFTQLYRCPLASPMRGPLQGKIALTQSATMHLAMLRAVNTINPRYKLSDC